VIVLDTNVLVYAASQSTGLGPVASDLLSHAGSAPLRTTARVIEEFAHVFARRGRPRTLAVERARDFAEVLGPLTDAGEDEFARAFELWLEHPRLDIADALLAALALGRDATLVSADRAYEEVTGLRFVHLADPDIHERLHLNAK
jgi:predicted nucleic acid-binding protein